MFVYELESVVYGLIFFYLLCCNLQKSRKTKTPTKHTVEEVEKVKKEGEKIKEKQNLKKYVLSALG